MQNKKQPLGTYVSRSVYQKQVEENRRLLADIKVLTAKEFGYSAQKLRVIMKWREKFKQQAELNKMIYDLLGAHFKDKPEENAK